MSDIYVGPKVSSRSQNLVLANKISYSQKEISPLWRKISTLHWAVNLAKRLRSSRLGALRIDLMFWIIARGVRGRDQDRGSGWSRPQPTTLTPYPSVRSIYIGKLEFRLYLCISKQALVLQAKKAGSNHYFLIWPLDLWPMWPLGHVFSKGCIFKNGDT